MYYELKKKKRKRIINPNIGLIPNIGIREKNAVSECIENNMPKGISIEFSGLEIK
ncbi:MAG: hypothetical protein V1815_00790 [Candidatus Woesearchaeota archaeon]